MQERQTILVAMDSFKGSLSSAQANGAVMEGIRQINPNQSIQSIEVADGGEGTVAALTGPFNLTRRKVTVHDANGRPTEAVYGHNKKTKRAVIEVASACGLPQLKKEERNPLTATSFGVGQLITDALSSGARRIYLGLGGSATTDAGVGMLQALGYRFLAQDGTEITEMQELTSLASIDETRVHPALEDCQFTIICDVDNVFYGPTGAAYVYGPQKGASERDVVELNDRLIHVAKVITEHTGIDVQSIQGAGAAGGLGGACSSLLQAELKRGAELILEETGVMAQIADYAFIFSGEGKIDGQTFQGKLPQAIGQFGHRFGIPVILLGGSVDAPIEHIRTAGITAAFSITQQPVALEEMMQPKKAYDTLKYTAANLYALWMTMR
ncbi:MULTISPECIES: glycerate kinase [unclassified Exiguobacterium]|uniref:glycerate kinase n=1 Tax=unclassified Exiguobacterium TaxID=2644629 RepID=UPI001BED13DC|nr:MULTISPECIES: glycerate kinase [unclassified Exiguobacterium]